MFMLKRRTLSLFVVGIIGSCFAMHKEKQQGQPVACPGLAAERKQGDAARQRPGGGGAAVGEKLHDVALDVKSPKEIKRPFRVGDVEYTIVTHKRENVTQPAYSVNKDEKIISIAEDIFSDDAMLFGYLQRIAITSVKPACCGWFYRLFRCGCCSDDTEEYKQYLYNSCDALIAMNRMNAIAYRIAYFQYMIDYDEMAQRSKFLNEPTSIEEDVNILCEYLATKRLAVALCKKFLFSEDSVCVILRKGTTTIQGVAAWDQRGVKQLKDLSNSVEYNPATCKRWRILAPDVKPS